MSRARGLVVRGRALCEGDGKRYVQVFSGKRETRNEKAKADVELMRAPFFGEPSSGVDAPEWMPSGGMVSPFEHEGMGCALIVWRDGSK